MSRINSQLVRSNLDYILLMQGREVVVVGLNKPQALDKPRPKYMVFVNKVYEFDCKIHPHEMELDERGGYPYRNIISMLRYKLTDLTLAQVDKKEVYYLKRPVS